MTIAQIPPHDEPGYGPGHLSAVLDLHLASDRPHLTLEVNTIRADRAGGATGKAMLRAAFESARARLADSASGVSADLEVPATPGTVRLNHIQNHQANEVICRHYEALRTLAARPDAPVFQDYLDACAAVRIPGPGATESDDAYMEKRRKTSSDTLSHVDPKNAALDYADPDLPMLPTSHDQRRTRPLAEDINAFLLNRLTTTDGCLAATAHRMVADLGGGAVTGISFDAQLDSMDLHVSAPAPARQP